MARYCLVFGYGQVAGGGLSPQTKDRCDQALTLWQNQEIDAIYLTVSAEKDGILMADVMRNYLASRGVRWQYIVVDPRGGNTAGELDVFLKHVEVRRKEDELFALQSTDCAQLAYEFGRQRIREGVFLISSWYHLPGIKYLSWVRGLRCRSLVAWHYVHWRKDVLKEFLKFAKAVLYPITSSKVLP